MQTHPGIFLVIEGSDGAGKGTQFELLHKRLTDEGYEVAVFDFPRYDETSSHFVRKYLNGDYGPAADVSPYTASLFYALDRYEASWQIRKALAEGKIVLANRYVGSNMAHQGGKFKDSIDKRSFFVWEDSLEYQLLGIPRPNMNFYLRVPAEISYELIAKKAKRNYTDASRDEHEANIEHLKQSVATYDLLCQLFPKDFKAIDCAGSGQLANIESVAEMLWQHVEIMLPAKDLPAPAAKEEPSQHMPSQNEPGSTYSWEVSGLSLRTIMLLKQKGLEVDLNLDNQWAGPNSGYKYYMPTSLLKTDAQKTYTDTYKEVVELHKKVFSRMQDFYKNKGLKTKQARERSLTIARSMVPMGALYKCRITARLDTSGSIMNTLRGSGDGELQIFSKKLESTLKKVWPDIDLETSRGQISPEPINKILANLNELGMSQHLAGTEPARLAEASPKNEFDLLADGIFPFSDLSREEINSAITGWDYQQKARTLGDAIKSNPGLLESVDYRFDAIVDRVSALELQNLNSGANMLIQQATVRYGYEVPEDIEAAGQEDNYMQAFDSFLELYSQLQAKPDDSSILDYATLAGHKVRLQVRLTANSIIRLHTRDAVDATFLQLLDELVGGVHPIVSEYMAGRLSASSKSP